jgi:arginine decarboxylase-like protein
MNERIRELADQADVLADNVIQMPGEYHPDYGRVWNEKFAELIVRECADICNQAILQNQDTLSELKEDELAEKMVIHGSIKQAQKLCKGIKQHFGVE